MLIPGIKKIFYLLFIFLLTVNYLQAQDKKISVRDTSKTAIKDSTAADSAKVKKAGDIDAAVFSTASDSMLINIKSRKIQVFGKGTVKYKQTDLKGARIYVDHKTSELEAYGVPDSTGKKLKDTPILTEGGQVYDGDWMRYNFKTQQGFISAAKNKVKDTRYEGEKVKKVDKETYFIENGIFTTCSEKEPHTHFSASQMKVMTDDKIVAKWVFMHIAGIPVPLPLPMAVIPNQTGRRSGIIMPGYGDDRTRGLYLSHLGYFFALSDYYDLALTSDLYSRGGFGLKGRIRYNKRYDFSGELNAGFSNNISDEGTNKNWNFSLNHNQNIDPTSTLVAQMQFQSSSYNRYNTYDYNSLLRQQIFSTATYSKTFEDLGASMSLSYQRTQDIETGNYSESLPSLNFSKQMFYPFKSKKKEGIIDQQWYELIGVNYSANFENKRVKDSSLVVHAGIRHNLTINASPKIGFFTLTPSINYTERWYNKRIEKQEVAYLDNEGNTKYKIVDNVIDDISFVRSFNLSLATSTKLYGMMPANFLGIEAFRHTITPSIAYNFTPDFSKDSWGYYGSFITHEGKTIRYDKYGNEIFGGAGAGESQNISFSIGNVFELKTQKDPTDTTSQSKKIQLLNFSIGSAYNFARDSLRLSDLNTSFRTQIGEILDFSGSANYTFYEYKNGIPVNTYLASAGRGLFRITSFYFTISTSLSPEKFGSLSEKNTTAPKSDGDLTQNANYRNEPLINTNTDASADYSIPWNLGLNFNYSSNSSNPELPSSVTSGIGVNFSMSLTKKWKLTFYGNYDFQAKQISAPQITVNRDLHCWEMNLTWRPLGLYRGFYFVIRMKAPEFQDIKYEKTEGQFSGLR